MVQSKFYCRRIIPWKMSCEFSACAIHFYVEGKGLRRLFVSKGKCLFTDLWPRNFSFYCAREWWGKHNLRPHPHREHECCFLIFCLEGNSDCSCTIGRLLGADTLLFLGWEDTNNSQEWPNVMPHHFSLATPCSAASPQWDRRNQCFRFRMSLISRRSLIQAMLKSVLEVVFVVVLISWVHF